MGFLIIQDYKAQIKLYDLDDLDDFDDTSRQTAELMAQSEMESYLRDRYNVATIFSQAGTNRSPDILMRMIDLTLYHLFAATPREMPEIRKNRYEGAIKWLDAVRKGDLNPNLPANTDTRGNKLQDSVFRSNIRNRYNW